MRKVIIGPLLVAVFALLTFSSARATSNTVRIVGTEDFKPNVRIYNTWHFQAGTVTAKSGETITWVNETEAPHTVTILNKDDVPSAIEDLFACDDPNNTSGYCTMLNAVFAGHFATDPPTPVLNQGQQGLNQAGDSLWIDPQSSVSAVISASSGSNLYYVCALHPWMQGVIKVR